MSYNVKEFRGEAHRPLRCTDGGQATLQYLAQTLPATFAERNVPAKIRTDTAKSGGLFGSQVFRKSCQRWKLPVSHTQKKLLAVWKEAVPTRHEQRLWTILNIRNHTGRFQKIEHQADGEKVCAAAGT